MADNVIDRRTDRFRKTAVVQRCRDCCLRFRDELMTNAVQFLSRNPHSDMLANHIEHIGCQTAGNTHLIPLSRGFDRYIHRNPLLVRARYGIKRAPQRQ
jgi:hypothetical protein